MQDSPEREHHERRVSDDADARLRTVLSHAPIILFQLDGAGTFTSLEGRDTDVAALGLPGDPAHALGRTVFDVCSQVPELIDSCRLALAGHEHTAAFQCAGQHFEGRYEPIRDERGNPDGMVAALLDITEHREMEQALERSEARRIEAERMAAMGALAGGIAHQINNALTAARLCLGRLVSFERAQRPHTPQGLHRIELLQEAREALSRIARVAQELRSFSRVETEAAELVDLREVLDGVVRITAHELKHRARVVVELSELPPVRGSETALRHVFLNLVLNAAQSIPEGYAHLNELRLTASEAPGGQVMVEITDTGVGIPPDQLSRVFEPFFTTRPTGQGLGLGLSTCRETVAAHGGTIAMDSEVGTGTRVTVTLPAADHRERRAVTCDPVAREVEDQRRTRVLIIDDDRPVAAALALELTEHDVVVAGSGREALEILRRDTRFDAVLCDVMMPELSGIDLFHWVQPIEPQLAKRFVFMTGGAFTARAQRFLAEIDNPRLDKPFPTSELLDVIAALARAADQELPRSGLVSRTQSAKPRGQSETDA